MSRLLVDLYDAVRDVNPFLTIPDGVPFVDLNPLNGADRAARVVVRTGPDYHLGDHVRLLDEARPVKTDMVTIDPLVHKDVDLNAVNFSDKTAAVEFQLNPTGEFRVRIDLHDQLGQPYPNLSLYDWQAPTGEPIDLNPLNFADKAARVQLTAGGVFHPGDRVRLLDAVSSVETYLVTHLWGYGRYVDLNPLVHKDVDLNAVNFSDKTAAVEFQLNPTGELVESSLLQ